MSVELRGVTKRFDGRAAVDGVSLTVAPGELLALLGPSGCGKSTLLAIVAGLTAPDEGDVLLDGRSVLDVPAERRDVSLVFQRPLLFPHLTVAQNVGFGLRMQRVPRTAIRGRVADMLERVHLPGLGERRVGELSGGQEQRVALARALVLEPQVLLLDEPFSALDAALRAEMRTLVRELHSATGVTTVFVTHDQAEAVEVAQRVGLMTEGAVTEVAEPERFYRVPPSLAAARFFGTSNEVTGTVQAGCFVSADLRVPTDVPDGPAVLVARAEHLRLHPVHPHVGAEQSELNGTITAARFAGTHVVVELTTPGYVWTAHVPTTEPVVVGSRAGATVDVTTVFPA